jgi:hypothetical protein
MLRAIARSPSAACSSARMQQLEIGSDLSARARCAEPDSGIVRHGNKQVKTGRRTAHRKRSDRYVGIKPSLAPYNFRHIVAPKRRL